MQLTQEQEKKIKRVAKLVDFETKGAVILLEDIFALEDKLGEKIPELTELVEELRKERPDRDEIKEIVNELIGGIEIPEAINGEKGDKGDDYVLTEEDKKEIASKIKVPVVEKVIEKTEVIKEKPIEIIKEVAVITDESFTSHNEAIRDGLELFTDEEDKLKISAIGHLPEELDKLRKLASERKGGMVGKGLLSQMNDTNIQSPTTGQVLKLDANGLWTNQTDNDAQDLQSVTDIGATTTNSLTASSFIKSGGTSLQFLKADGSIDDSTYITASALSPYWKSDGSSTATGNWSIGSYEFTSAQVNTPIIINTGGNTITFKNLLNSTLGIIDSNGNTWTGIHSSPLGTVSAPSYSFTGDLNTGIYSPSADILGITTGGVERARFTTTGAIITTASAAVGGIVTEQLVANTWTNSTLVNKLISGSVTINQSGTAGFTLVDFSYSLTTVGSGETNLLRFSQSGSDYFKIAASGQVTGRLGSATIPTYSFVGDTNTGFYSAGADQINATTGGTVRFSMSTTAIASTLPMSIANATPNLTLESSAANAVNAGTIVMRTPGGSESFTLKFDASANIASMLYGATTAMTITGTNVTSSLAHLFANGTASLPSVSFASDTNTGMYRVNADQLGFATAGGNRLTINSGSIASNNIPFEAITFRVLNTTDTLYTYLKTGGAGSNSGGVYGDGHLILTTTGAGNYADINIIAGETISSQIGGNITVTAGLSEASVTDGGYISHTGGYSYGGNGGYLSFIGGSASSGTGGYVNIFGGDSSAGGGTPGGQIDIRGGINTNDSLYAPVYLQSNGGLTSIGAGYFVVDTYSSYIQSNLDHYFSAIAKFNSTMQTSGMPTADPADGQGTLWYDTTTNAVYRGT